MDIKELTKPLNGTTQTRVIKMPVTKDYPEIYTGAFIRIKVKEGKGRSKKYTGFVNLISLPDEPLEFELLYFDDEIWRKIESGTNVQCEHHHFNQGVILEYEPLPVPKDYLLFRVNSSYTAVIRAGEQNGNVGCQVIPFEAMQKMVDFMESHKFDLVLWGKKAIEEKYKNKTLKELEKIYNIWKSTSSTARTKHSQGVFDPYCSCKACNSEASIIKSLIEERRDEEAQGKSNSKYKRSIHNKYDDDEDDSWIYDPECNCFACRRFRNEEEDF